MADLDQHPEESALRIYAWMRLARTADNRILELFRQGLIKGTVTGGQGNEWMVIPLALLADKAIDVVCFTHRGLGGHLIWGGHLCEHLNQYFANAHSPTRAREGNIHHGDPDEPVDPDDQPPGRHVRAGSRGHRFAAAFWAQGGRDLASSATARPARATSTSR